MNSKTHNLNLVENIRAIKKEIARLQGLLEEAGAELHSEGTGPTLSEAPAGRKGSKGKPARPRLVGGTREALELVEGSAAFLAAAAIRTAGKPLHVLTLIKAIEDHGQKVKLSTLVGALSRWVKRKAVFYRAGKNTFGLIEMRKG